MKFLIGLFIGLSTWSFAKAESATLYIEGKEAAEILDYLILSGQGGFAEDGSFSFLSEGVAITVSNNKPECIFGDSEEMSQSNCRQLIKRLVAYPQYEEPGEIGFFKLPIGIVACRASHQQDQPPIWCIFQK